MTKNTPKPKHAVILPKTPDLEALPVAEWSNSQIGEYVDGLLKRMAKDIWKTGKALQIVRDRTKQGEWESWCAKYVPLSQETIRRFRKVASEMTYEACADKTATEVYRQLGLLDTPKPKPTPATPSSPAPSAPVDPTSEADVQGQDSETASEDYLKADEIIHKITETDYIMAALDKVLKLIAIEAEWDTEYDFDEAEIVKVIVKHMMAA